MIETLFADGFTGMCKSNESNSTDMKYSYNATDADRLIYLILAVAPMAVLLITSDRVGGETASLPQN